ncbi:30S ribosomal protein S8e [Candidatus Pacearchaeota archaeon]|nr:30S ribosomal protein S8e [Candidatus Pacearchaeota archaeon]
MKSGRKITGGRYHKSRKKRKHELDSQTKIVNLGADKRKKVKVRGGNEKVFMLSAETINLIDKKTKKSEKHKILNVLETPANRFLARQNILIKGAIVKTEKGKAKITNRPSQEGNVQGVLISE